MQGRKGVGGGALVEQSRTERLVNGLFVEGHFHASLGVYVN